MPYAFYQTTVPVAAERIWAFVHNISNWAKWMPGYQGCEIRSETESVWKLRADFGAFERAVQLIAVETEQVVPHEVQFRVTGIDENVHGEGKYTAESLADGGTIITLELTMKVAGLLGPFLNVMLDSALPGMVRELGYNLSEAIVKAQLP